MTIARRATPDDADELLRLRVLMFADINQSGAGDSRWQEPARRAFVEQLALSDSYLQAFVVDKPDAAGLAASALAFVHQRIPGPGNPAGLGAHIGGVATDPEYRRRGYARACMDSLVDWSRGSGLGRLELRTSAEAESMYTAMGFQRTSNPEMTLRL